MNPSDEPYFQRAFPAAEFVRRRTALADRLRGGVAVLQGAPATGAFDLFRQYNDFFYLSGVECPHSYLTIDSRGGHNECVLYLPPTDEHLASTEGAELSLDRPDEVLRLTGCDDVRPLGALAESLQGASDLFVCRQPQESRQACQDTLRVKAKFAAADPWRRPKQEFAEAVAELSPGSTLHDLSPTLLAMRLIKSEAEIAQMRLSGRLTAMAVSEAMRCTAPGLIEGQLAAVAEYVYRINGASGGGYRPIIASGANIWNIHYYRNDCPLVDGDLVLMDYAPDCDCYTSDIGRMWPVRGTYRPWQRELYSFVVDFHLTLLDLLGPGKTSDEVRQQARDKMMPIVERTNWMRPSFEEAARNLLEGPNPLTHGVGMAVHEGPGYLDGELRPGMVFALDPQLWVRQERLYFRVEDTVVITETGVENLTAECPHDLDAVTRLMQEPGVTKLRPDLLIG